MTPPDRWARADAEASRVRVYTPASALRSPAGLAREMAQDLWRGRGLAWRLFLRDTRARYRQSALGYLWALLPPVVATLAFVLLSRSGIVSTGAVALPYPVYVLIGTILWQTFADALMSPLRTLTAAKPMLAKVDFPREALLLSGLLDVGLNLLIRVVLLSAVLAWYGIVPAASFPLALGCALALAALGFVIGVLVAPLGLLYTDVGQGLGLLLPFWMLVTPIVYTAEASALATASGAFNPVSPLVATARDWLITGETTQLAPTLWVGGITLLLAFVGWVLYRITMPILAERIGS